MATPLGVAVSETLPQGPGEQDTFQVTPLLLGSCPTMATIFGTVPPAITVVAGAVTETVTEGTVMVTLADLVGSATEVAVTVSVRSLTGTVAGAL